MGYGRPGKRGEVQKCALGHCGLSDFDYEHNAESAALCRLLSSYTTPAVAQSMFREDGDVPESFVHVWFVNDDNHETYFEGATPKERILNVLKKIRADQDNAVKQALQALENKLETI